jgi:hypothetical protein
MYVTARRSKWRYVQHVAPDQATQEAPGLTADDAADKAIHEALDVPTDDAADKAQDQASAFRARGHHATDEVTGYGRRQHTFWLSDGR